MAPDVGLHGVAGFCLPDPLQPAGKSRLQSLVVGTFAVAGLLGCYIQLL